MHVVAPVVILMIALAAVGLALLVALGDVSPMKADPVELVHNLLTVIRREHRRFCISGLRDCDPATEKSGVRSAS